MNIYVVTARDWESFEEYPKCIVVADNASEAGEIGRQAMECKSVAIDRINETVKGVVDIEI